MHDLVTVTACGWLVEMSRFSAAASVDRLSITRG